MTSQTLSPDHDDPLVATESNAKASLCEFCGKTECSCWDESDPSTIVPNDHETNPAVFP